MKLIIFETDELIAKASENPHHSRENGGHIIITTKQRFAHRQEMPLTLASKLMHLTMIVGEAATNVLRKKGLDVIRINYQDNGNWAYKESAPKPHLHIHLYIRTSHERHPDNDEHFQAFPDALYLPDKSTGYYDNFKPLTERDCTDIGDEIQSLFQKEKYQGIEL